MTDVILAFTNAQPGREQAFDDWYTAEHLPAVLEVEGIVGARRLEAAHDLQDGPQHPYRFLAVYDVVAGEVGATAERLITVGPPMSGDADGVPAAWCYEEVSPHVAAEGAGEGPFDQMIVLTNPTTPEGEEAFNRWYDEVHTPDVMNTIGGYVGARRFRRIEDLVFNRGNPWSYMALWDIPKGTMAHCYDRLKWSRLEREEALAAGRAPAVPIAPEMSDERLAWFYRETLSWIPATA